MLVTPRDGKYVEAIERLIGKKLPTRTLEGLSEAVEARPARDDRRSGGGGGRDRNRGGRGNDRDRKREYPVKPHGQVASMDPVAPSAVQSAPAQQAPAQPVPVQQIRNDNRQDHRQRQNQPRPPKPAGKPQQHQQDDDMRDTRSQLPAFLLRPVPLPKVVEKSKATKPSDAKR